MPAIGRYTKTTGQLPFTKTVRRMALSAYLGGYIYSLPRGIDSYIPVEKSVLSLNKVDDGGDVELLLEM